MPGGQVPARLDIGWGVQASILVHSEGAKVHCTATHLVSMLDLSSANKPPMSILALAAQARARYPNAV